ncbi:hypothetical protein AB0J35_41890 [Nonomuraea angiospora]|uniref:hypothetical protein n=1 Tax=Nonomuraea angiospora TaxID=46172 RepID=UPI003434E373
MSQFNTFPSANFIWKGQESSISDSTSYAATLSAISAGNQRRSKIAAALGRPVSALAHLLNGLRSIGLVEQVDDALRDKRSVFRIAEPIVRLHQLITQRRELELVSGQAARVWRSNADTVASKVYGPHLTHAPDSPAIWWRRRAGARTWSSWT